ncbi:MMPL family transporter, partial [Nocardia sp. NPDC059246]|uniref:MMPL family transporter n=1 Tax=unclassified Nocardia TaxID=2637762 RepID=UPI003677187B
DPMIRQFGFALAVGVVVDAFVVRMMLVPAVMSIFGDTVWWLPRTLDRVLPNIDIEGRGPTTRSADSLAAPQDLASSKL